MDCSIDRSKSREVRNSDLDENLSNDENSEDEMRICDSVESNESNEQHHHQHNQQNYNHHHYQQQNRLQLLQLRASQQQQSQQQQEQQQFQSRLSSRHLNHSLSSSNNNNIKGNNTNNKIGDMSFVSTSATSAAGSIVGGGGSHSPAEQTELQINHHHQFPPNHPLNALGNFMGIGGLHGIPNLQHSDVLEKLKMQVRDMKVGLMEQDYVAHAAAFGGNVLPTPINTAFTLPPTSTMSSFGHISAGGNVVANGNSSAVNSSNNHSNAISNGSGIGGGGGGVNNSGGSFSFTSPTPPNKDVNPASNSSASSEASSSSTQQNSSWSFEEQYKQVRQSSSEFPLVTVRNYKMLIPEEQIQELYEINDDPKRKEFLDELFSFMQKRGTPINRLPIMAKSVLDLYELYNLVIARGGLVEVINKKLWQEIIKGLHLPSSITSAAFTLRTQYMKYLYPYECDKMNLSAPAELQAAIDGNRREGRRSSYGQYESMHSQMQLPQIARQSLSGSMQQMSPLALVTHAANTQQAHAVAAAAAAHQRLIAGPSFGQMQQELEQRMLEYLKIIQGKKEPNTPGATTALGSIGNNGSNNGMSSAVSNANSLVAAAVKQQQQQLQQSPDISTCDALNALEMSRVALWSMYHNNTSPPTSINTSPPPLTLGGGSVGNINALRGKEERDNGHNGGEQQREALNLSDTPPHLTAIKREHPTSPEPIMDGNECHQPPMKRTIFPSNLSAFPANFYHGMAAAAAANFQNAANAARHVELDGDAENDDELDDDAEHNITGNSLSHDEHETNAPLNGHNHHSHHNHNNLLQHDVNHVHHNNIVAAQHNQHDKSDDSAIENSPSTSAASANNGHISPISTKKIHLSKQAALTTNRSSDGASTSAAALAQTLNPFEAFNLLLGLQFKVERISVNASGQREMHVNLELNGFKYTGMLTASALLDEDATNTSIKTTATTDEELLTKTQKNIDHTENMATEDLEDTNAHSEDEHEAYMEVNACNTAAISLTVSNSITKSPATPTKEAATSSITNGPTTPATVTATATALKDSLITT